MFLICVRDTFCEQNGELRKVLRDKDAIGIQLLHGVANKSTLILGNLVFHKLA